MSKDTSKNIKWIDGLRGIASFTVVCTHLSRAFDYGLFLPRDSPEASVRIAQLPFIRILFQGKVGVAIFALLTGYVCALKPLKLARNGRQSDALSAIAKSAFRRPPRLILPQIIAMLIAWSMCQVRGFRAASRSDSDWLRYSSAVPEPSLWLEIQRLYSNFMGVWTTGVMEYDDHQWALLPFLKGSMIVFIVCSALIFTKFRYRMVAYLAYLTYWWLDTLPDTETFGQQMIFGMLLVDLAHHPSYQRILSNHTRICTCLSIPTILFGWFLISYPDASPEWSSWSFFLDNVSQYIFPSEISSTPKRFTALGVDIVAFGIQACHPAKAVLSNTFFLWLGKNSFAVYLIHGTLLRSVLAWMLYGITGEPFNPEPTITLKHADGWEEVHPEWLPRRAHGALFWIVIAIWLLIVYGCAELWTKYVDAWCGRLTKMIEDKVTIKDGETEGESQSAKMEKGTAVMTTTESSQPLLMAMSPIDHQTPTTTEGSQRLFLSVPRTDHRNILNNTPLPSPSAN